MCWTSEVQSNNSLNCLDSDGKSTLMLKLPVMIIGSLQMTTDSRKEENSSMKEIVTGCFSEYGGR